MKRLTVLTCLFFLLLSSTLNSQTYVSGSINDLVFWGIDRSPYIITDSLIIEEGAKLSLENGVIVMFKYHPEPDKKSFMRVDGDIRLWTYWNESDGFIFTSERDDSYGDINGDGTATIAKPGDWGYIQINSKHSNVFEDGFEMATFKYGGGRNPDSISSPDLYPMVDVRKTRQDEYEPQKFYACNFLYSKGAGMRLGIGNLITCKISNCKNGILLSSPVAAITGSYISDNEQYPFVIDGFDIPWEYRGSDNPAFLFSEFTENTVANNGIDYIAIGGNFRTVYDSQSEDVKEATLTVQNYQLPYMLVKPLRVNSLDLQIDGGNQIKVKYFQEKSKKPYIFCDSLSSFIVSTPVSGLERTVFTSQFDHKYDAVLYKGSDREPLSGDWGYIEAYDIDIDNCVISYGGVYTNPITGDFESDSSAAIRIRVNSDESNECLISNCSFNNLYATSIMFMCDANPSGYETSISNNSFLLNKNAFGVKVLAGDEVPVKNVYAANNYWYGKQGPYHAYLNSVGNGCRVSDYVNFSPFQKESDDVLELFSSVLMGTVKNLDGDKLPGAMIKIPGKREKVVFSKSDGSYYIPNVYQGYGYEMQAYKGKYFDTTIINIKVYPDTTQIVDISMRARTIDYLVDTITFKVNPRVSEVQVGGTAYRYYKIVDKKSHDPVYGAEVFVAGLVDTFYTNYKGIVTIPISWDKVGSASSTRRFYISKVGIESLPYPPEMQMPFSVRVHPREYSKMWGGNLWLKEGISVVELKQEVGASVGVQIEDHGIGEVAENLVLERGFKAGAGINLGAEASAKLGPVKAGAEASIGANLSAYMQDQFIFDYENAYPEYAVAKFIVLAGSASQYLDSPLHRYLSVALYSAVPDIDNANYSNSVGLNFMGQASAGAGLGITLKDSDGKESPIGAELKGNVESQGEIDFLFTSYAKSNQLDFKLAYNAEIGVGVNAGVGFDIAKLFGSGDEKEKDDKNKTTNSNSGKEDKKDENEFEIEIPELLSAGASGGVKYGASIEAVRGIASPYTTLGFMYGYKYSAGLQATPFFGDGVGEDREYHFDIDFHDSFLKSMVEEKLPLANDIGNALIDNLNLDISSLSGADILQIPLEAIAEAQKKNAFSFPAVPYEHSVTDLVGDGEFAVEIAFGLGPVKAKFGGGIEYTEANDYLLKSGVFYDWGLYPLQEYPYVEDNDAFDVGIILQDILTETGKYMWEAIKDELIPPVFKKIPIWPFTLLKGSGPYVIPAGPESRNSVLTVDALSVQDSVFIYYWDWYGTEGISRKKSAISANRLAILDQMKGIAVERHKLDYGIGGFYQFEPNGKVISDSAVLTINYSDEELDVLMADGTECQVKKGDLRMYVEDKSNSKWVLVGGEVDTVNNTVTARIDSLGTFTLAPFIPYGDLELTLSSDTLFVEEGNSVQVSSNEIYYNVGEMIEDGEEFNVIVSKGFVVESDVNPDVEGLQLGAQAGRIHFTFKSDSISGVAYIKVESRKGDAAGIKELPINENIKPEAPVLVQAALSDYKVNLKWNPSADIDVSYYLVNFGTLSGGPYTGTASVAGENSPVKVGTASTASLKGLYKDSLYYFTVCAVDRAGNVSDFSNEMTLSTSFNHRPMVYARVFRIDPELAQGTIIDTMWAKDTDRDHVLSFYFAENNSCTAFNLSAETGIISVKDASQLDYWSTGIDTLSLQIGVRDDGPGTLSDSCTVLIVLDVETGRKRYLTDEETWFKAYPNPAKDRLTVTCSKIINPNESFIEIIGLQGNVVKRVKLNGYDNLDSFDLDLDECHPGIYFIRLITDNGSGIQRIVVL